MSLLHIHWGLTFVPSFFHSHHKGLTSRCKIAAWAPIITSTVHITAAKINRQVPSFTGHLPEATGKVLFTSH